MNNDLAYKNYFIGDDKGILKLLNKRLANLGEMFNLSQVNEREQIFLYLYRNISDLLFCDYELSNWNKMDLLSEVENHKPTLPISLLFDNREEKITLTALLRGAFDCVFKNGIEKHLTSVQKEFYCIIDNIEKRIVRKSILIES